MSFWLKQYRISGSAFIMRQAAQSAGYDIQVPQSGVIRAMGRSLIKLGFKAQFTQGYVGLLLDRSSMGNKGVTRFAGVIDPTYPDEWGAILYNSTEEDYFYKYGDKIIQCVFVKFETSTEDPEWLTSEEWEQLLESSERVGGFGSTGV